jgi:hypothetical protein
MRFQQTRFLNSKALSLQPGDALNEKARHQNQHQRHGHFRDDQNIADALSRPA